MELFYEPYVALFIIATLGALLSKIKIKKVGLGSSAFVLVALYFGHLGIELPVAIERIGLILFIFSVGIEAGPGFFDSFKTGEVKQFLLPVLGVIFITAILSKLFCEILGLNSFISSGLFTGVMTSTASLAAVIEMTKSTDPILPYTIAYPVSMIMIVIFLRFLPKFIRLNPELEEKNYRNELKQHFPEIYAKFFVVENPSITTNAPSKAHLESLTGAKITRVKKFNELEGLIPNDTLKLEIGDHVKAIGSQASLENIGLIIGREIKEEIALSKQIVAEWILVTQKEVVGKKLKQLNLDGIWKAHVSRIKRAGIDIIPSSYTRLRYGDKILVTVDSSTLPHITTMLGGVETTTIDFLPVSLSVLLGIVLSQVNLTISNINFSFGLAGGILIMTLILGRLGRTGPFLWSIAGSTNQFLRQLGIMFFLAGVGTRTGKFVIDAFTIEGFKLIVVAFSICLLTLLINSLLCLKFLKMNKLKLLGALAGSLTCAPALSSINEEYSSSIPSTAYSITFPFALLITILTAQLLAIL